MHKLKAFGVSSLFLAALLNSFALSMYLYAALIELFQGTEFIYEKDWVYKYSPLIALPLWSALAALSEDKIWKVFLLQIMVTFWITSALIVVSGVLNIIEGTSLIKESIATILIGLALMFISNKINKKLTVEDT